MNQTQASDIAELDQIGGYSSGIAPILLFLANIFPKYKKFWNQGLRAYYESAMGRVYDERHQTAPGTLQPTSDLNATSFGNKLLPNAAKQFGRRPQSHFVLS